MHASAYSKNYCMPIDYSFLAVSVQGDVKK